MSSLAPEVLMMTLELHVEAEARAEHLEHGLQSHYRPWEAAPAARPVARPVAEVAPEEAQSPPDSPQQENLHGQ